LWRARGAQVEWFLNAELGISGLIVRALLLNISHCDFWLKPGQNAEERKKRSLFLTFPNSLAVPGN
jgi:hypothetical protein